jgi:hypothetical protein
MARKQPVLLADYAGVLFDLRGDFILEWSARMNPIAPACCGLVVVRQDHDATGAQVIKGAID